MLAVGTQNTCRRSNRGSFYSLLRAFWAPFVQNGAQDFCSVFLEGLPGCARGISGGVSYSHYQDYSVRNAAHDSGIGHQEHRRAVDNYSVELASELREQFGELEPPHSNC